MSFNKRPGKNKGMATLTIARWTSASEPKGNHPERGGWGGGGADLFGCRVAQMALARFCIVDGQNPALAAWVGGWVGGVGWGGVGWGGVGWGGVGWGGVGWVGG